MADKTSSTSATASAGAASVKKATTTTANESIATTVTNVSDKVYQLFGGVKVKLGHDYKAAAGMNANEIATFERAMKDYIAKAQGVLDKYNADADLDNVFKGQVNVKLKEFLASFKTLLKGYINTLEYETKEIKEANQRFESGASKVAKSISADTSKLRSQAKKLNLG